MGSVQDSVASRIMLFTTRNKSDLGTLLHLTEDSTGYKK